MPKYDLVSLVRLKKFGDIHACVLETKARSVPLSVVDLKVPNRTHRQAYKIACRAARLMASGIAPALARDYAKLEPCAGYPSMIAFHHMRAADYSMDFSEYWAKIRKVGIR